MLLFMAQITRMALVVTYIIAAFAGHAQQPLRFRSSEPTPQQEISQ